MAMLSIRVMVTMPSRSGPDGALGWDLLCLNRRKVNCDRPVPHVICLRSTFNVSSWCRIPNLSLPVHDVYLLGSGARGTAVKSEFCLSNHGSIGKVQRAKFH